MRRGFALLSLLLALALPAFALDLAGALTQGGLVVGRAAPGAKVALDGKQVRVSPEGAFVIGFGREAKSATLEITEPGKKTERQVLKIAAREFEIQRIDGLPEAFVTPPPELAERIKQEEELVAGVRLRDDARTDFLGGFVWPATGRITGVYGSQRVLNGQSRAPHYGVDIAGPVGAPVLAPADATVTLAENLYFTGWTLILDHGHGLSSVLMHMQAVTATKGQRVKQGEEIGKLGATGRVTGAHLHWGMNLFKTRLDPALVVPPMPKAE